MCVLADVCMADVCMADVYMADGSTSDVFLTTACMANTLMVGAGGYCGYQGYWGYCLMHVRLMHVWLMGECLMQCMSDAMYG